MNDKLYDWSKAANRALTVSISRHFAASAIRPYACSKRKLAYGSRTLVAAVMLCLASCGPKLLPNDDSKQIIIGEMNNSPLRQLGQLTDFEFTPASTKRALHFNFKLNGEPWDGTYDGKMCRFNRKAR